MKKLLTVLLSFIVVASFAQQREAGPSKTKEDIQSRCMVVTGATNAADVVEAILGPGVTYSNVTANGIFNINPAIASIGFFQGGDCVPLGFDEGIILSSGTLANVVGPNSDCGTTGVLGLPGDPDLTALAGFQTYDASWIEFDFVPTESTIFIQYVFASEEYNEFVFSSFNDVFGFFVNGTNIALVPGTTDPVTINNVNHGFASCGSCGDPANGVNPDYYRDNACSPFLDIEADGMTVVLTATATVTPNETNTIKIAVADAGDDVLDSWVFVKAESFSTVNPEDPPIPVSDWALYLGILLMITFVIIRFRRMI